MTFLSKNNVIFSFRGYQSVQNLPVSSVIILHAVSFLKAPVYADCLHDSAVWTSPQQWAVCTNWINTFFPFFFFFFKLCNSLDSCLLVMLQRKFVFFATVIVLQLFSFKYLFRTDFEFTNPWWSTTSYGLNLRIQPKFLSCSLPLSPTYTTEDKSTYSSYWNDKSVHLNERQVKPEGSRCHRYSPVFVSNGLSFFTNHC